MEAATSEPAGEKTVEKPPRMDFEKNHAAIKTFIDGFTIRESSWPSNPEIAAGVGLSLSAIKDHMTMLKRDASRFDSFSSSTTDVLFGLLKSAKGGDARSAKLWFQIIEGWEERKRITQMHQNPYAGLTEEDMRKKAAQRRAAILARKKAMEAAKEIGLGSGDGA